MAGEVLQPNGEGEENDALVPQVEIVEAMEQSYVDYAMSVIRGRALPDVRDGLKPVQRRILYSMYQSGFTHNKPHRKCARIVGDCMGKYHPHGDEAIYNALVRMAQGFSLRVPLIDAQGNFGSIDGDPPAAMRYTEARLARVASELLEDLEKETVDFTPNFDESLQEPSFLPAKLPNLLVNGSQGIAVGMATNLAPFNLAEVCDGIVAVIDNPGTLPSQLLEVILGPDFPTGGRIIGRSGIRSIFTRGRGKVVVRGKYEVETTGKGSRERTRLVLTELPYQVNKAQLITHVALLVNKKKIDGILDIRDESDRKGIKVVLDLKPGTDPQVVVNQLYAQTQFQTNFSVINLVLVNGGTQPQVLTILDIIKEYVAHRDSVVTRRTKYDLARATKRLHMVEGLLVAVNNVDEVVEIVKNSPDRGVARDRLVERFDFSQEQAEKILEMRLGRLTALQRAKLVEEKAELEREIERCQELLKDRSKRMEVIKQEVQKLKETYGEPRRTEIVDEESDKVILKEDLIAENTVVVVLTKDQFIKRMSLSEYQTQGRGGVGKKGITVHEDDFVLDMCVASTHDTLVFFTKKGKAFSLRCFEVPEQSRTARGKNIVNLIKLNEDEVVAMFAVSDFSQDFYLLMGTTGGLVKKTPLREFRSIRSSGITAIKLRPRDYLTSVLLTTGEQDILMATKKGWAIRFDETEVPSYGRAAQGVKGIALRGDDEVIGLVVADEGGDFVTITKKGYGRRARFGNYRLIHRGGKGVINLKFKTAEDEVVDVRTCTPNTDLLIATKLGKIIRISADTIRLMGRATTGVRVISFQKEEDEVVAVASCSNGECEE